MAGKYFGMAFLNWWMCVKKDSPEKVGLQVNRNGQGREISTKAHAGGDFGFILCSWGTCLKVKSAMLGLRYILCPERSCFRFQQGVLGSK